MTRRAALTAWAAAAAPRWNILFIFTDDQPQRMISSYEGAYPWLRTPNIDALAASGVRFAHAYSGPWCSPSRAMMMTGQQLHAIEAPVQLRGGGGIAPLWTGALEGYRKGFIGKWDLPPGLAGQWDRSVTWNVAEPGVRFDPMHYYRGASLVIDGAPPRPEPGYSTDVYTDHAVEFITVPSPKPWFLWLCYGAPHVPNVPPDRHRALYADAPVELASEADMFGPREHVPRYQTARSEVTRNGGRIEREFPKGMLMRDLVRQYAATVRGIDDAVGRLVDALRRTRQLDRTLIVYTADDGMPFGEHGFINKTGPYDACQRVPFIVSGPAPVARGRVCRHPVAALDLVPTFFSAAGAKPPHVLHGHDLLPLLRDPDARWPHPVMLESFGFSAGPATAPGVTPYELAVNRPSPEGIPWWILLRQGRHKYIRTLVRDEIEELYDLEADPGEHRNLAVRRDHRTLLRRFRGALAAELERTGGRELARNLPAPREVVHA